MFPELEGEFSKQDYPPTKKIKIEPIEAADGALEYKFEFEYPYGTFDIELMTDLKGKPEEELDLKPIPPDEEQWFVTSFQPEPISMEDLRQIHAQEEEENKKREQEARLAQKRLEEEKARLRYEQQQQIAKQE